MLLSHPELRILFTTYGESVDLTGATLDAVGTTCSYLAPPGARLVGDRVLPLVKVPECDPLQGNPTGDFRLTVRLAQRNRIGVWTFVRPASDTRPVDQLIQVVGAPGRSGPFPLLRGRYVDHLPPSGTRRFTLLACLWQVAPGSGWIWIALAAAVILLLSGAAVTPGRDVSAYRSRSWFALRAALGAGCAAASLGLMYAVVSPPFHAPDETSHFLSYAEITKRPELADGTRQLALAGHFERLRFNADERFRPSDMGRPLTETWDETAYNALPRGNIGRWWLLLDPYLRTLSTSRTLLALRLTNVAVFAFMIALGVAAVVWLIDAPFPQLAVFTFLLIPSLPFFAMHVSNYALLTSGYVLFAFGVTAMVLGGRRAAGAGLILGLSAALLFTVSRSGLPMAALLAAVLAGRLIIGEAGAAGMGAAALRAIVFWAGLGAGLAVSRLLVDPLYGTYLTEVAPSNLPGGARTQALLLAYAPWIFAGCVAAAAGLEILLARLRLGIEEQTKARFTGIVCTMGKVAAAAIAGLMLVSLLVDFPALRSVNLGERPPLGEYVGEALLAVLGFFRLHRPDFLTSTSFWTGFGWLETIPPVWLTITLTTLTGIALIATLILFAGRRNAAGLVWFGVLAAGGALTLVLYAITTLRYSPDLHGRYLLGLYLSLLPACWAILMLKEPAGRGSVWTSRWVLAFSFCAAVHAYSLSFILSRYF